MVKATGTRFSVHPENKAAAVQHLQERGYSPVQIEKGDDGLIVLIFAPLPDDQMFGLAQALPGYLSARIGIVMGDNPPFLPERTD